MKKITVLVTIILFWINIISCGTPVLEDKTQEANFAKMQTGDFNAKYTYLNNVTVHGGIECDLYPDYANAVVYEDGTNNGYLLVDLDRKNGEYVYVKSSMGSEITNHTVNIKKAEVVAESLNKKSMYPILLVHESDIEYPKDKEIEEKLNSGKPYSELDIYYDMEYIENGELGYNKDKYSKRVQELINEYEKEKEIKYNQYQQERNTSDELYNKTFTARFGQFLECNVNGNVAVVKFKIEPSMTNGMTIDQNGYNIEDLILNQGADQYEEIQYWAVADMQDGSESKVISLTVNKDLINKIKNQNVVGNQIVDYAEDVWILPSLKY